MNTTINSTIENSTKLLVLSHSYDKVDITGVSTIWGTTGSITAIIESGNFIGISSQSLILSDPSVDDSIINYFTGKGFTIK